MTFTETVLDRAKERILALEITNTGALTRFFEKMSAPALRVTSADLVNAAVDRGLYRFVAESAKTLMDAEIGGSPTGLYEIPAARQGNDAQAAEQGIAA